jgi:hypothetical protein
MFLLYNEEDGELDGPPSADQVAPWMEFGEYAAGAAAQESGAALQPSATATTVSIRDDPNGPAFFEWRAAAIKLKQDVVAMRADLEATIGA